MKLFRIFGFTILQPIFSLPTSVAKQWFVFQMYFRFFKEPGWIICVFLGIRPSVILQVLTVISKSFFLPMLPLSQFITVAFG